MLVGAGLHNTAIIHSHSFSFDTAYEPLRSVEIFRGRINGGIECVADFMHGLNTFRSQSWTLSLLYSP